MKLVKICIKMKFIKASNALEIMKDSKIMLIHKQNQFHKYKHI